MANNSIKTFQDLEVWKKAHQNVLSIYQLINHFPKSETFGLISQIIRAGISVPTNIAEGKGRNTTKEYLRFLIIARGSNEELKYLLLLSFDLKYIDEKTFQNLNTELNSVGKMLNGLINSLKKPKKNN